MSTDNQTKHYQIYTPDGKTITRQSKHEYQYAVLVNIDAGGWFAAFCKDFDAMQATQRKYKNCPAAKQGAKVETQIVGVYGWVK